MSTTISLHLPSRDVARAVEFFTQVGFSAHPGLDTAGSTCMKISPEIYLMLHTRSDFRTITKKSVTDAASTAEAVMQLRVESRPHVDRMVDAALSAGGRPIHGANDQGWLYGRSFVDLDDHNWDIFWVDPKAAPA